MFSRPRNNPAELDLLAKPLYDFLLPLVIVGETKSTVAALSSAAAKASAAIEENPTSGNSQEKIGQNPRKLLYLADERFATARGIVANRELKVERRVPLSADKIKADLVLVCNHAVDVEVGKIFRRTRKQAIPEKVLSEIKRFCGDKLTLQEARGVCAVLKATRTTKNQGNSSNASTELPELIFKLLADIKETPKGSNEMPSVVTAALELVKILKATPEINYSLFNDWYDFVKDNSEEGTKIDATAEIKWLGDKFNLLGTERRGGSDKSNWLLRQLMKVGVPGIKTHLEKYEAKDLKTVVAALLSIHSVCFPKQVPESPNSSANVQSSLKISNILNLLATQREGSLVEILERVPKGRKTDRLSELAARYPKLRILKHIDTPELERLEIVAEKRSAEIQKIEEQSKRAIKEEIQKAVGAANKALQETKGGAFKRLKDSRPESFTPVAVEDRPVNLIEFAQIFPELRIFETLDKSQLDGLSKNVAKIQKLLDDRIQDELSKETARILNTNNGIDAVTKIANYYPALYLPKGLTVEELVRVSELVLGETIGRSVIAVQEAIFQSIDKVRNPKKYKASGGGGD